MLFHSPAFTFALFQPMFSMSPGMATNASAAAAAAAAFNPYLSPMSPGLMPQDIMPSTQVLMASSPNMSQVPNAAAAAAQKLLRTDRLEVTQTLMNVTCFFQHFMEHIINPLLPKSFRKTNQIYFMVCFSLGVEWHRMIMSL